jgi:hypothetical protein
MGSSKVSGKGSGSGGTRGKNLLDLFFGCRHRRTSFPVSPATKPGAPQGEMYIVCLNCGKHFHYDWERMRIGPPIENQVTPKSASVDSRKVIRYFVAAITLPVVWLIGKAALGRKEQKSESKHGKPTH